VIDRHKLEAGACECYRCLSGESQLNAAPRSVMQANAANANQWRQLPVSEPKRRHSQQYV
jgi:hypothetical protein